MATERAPGEDVERGSKAWPRADLLLWSAALIVGAAGLKRVVLQARELVVGDGYAAAFDLHLRYVEASRWLAGLPAYEVTRSNYPPATYAVLAPLIAPLEWPALRWVWLAACLVALVCISCCAAAAERRPAARALAAVIPWATYGTALTLGVGQLGILCVALGLGAVLLARRPGRGSARAVFAGLLFTLSLVKPTLAAPWFFVLATGAGGLVAAATAVAGYVAATVAALAMQPEPWRVLLGIWLDNTELHLGRGYGSLAELALRLGQPRLALPLGLVLLGLYGAWVLRHRRADPWLLLGVGALVARVFTYHYYVDDLLVMVPLVAVLRLATGTLAAPSRVRKAASVALAAALAAELLPTRLFDDFGPTVATWTGAVHVLEWAAMAAVLCWAGAHVAPGAILRPPAAAPPGA